ncbi:MAG: hypothetical protein KGZ74_06625 [Chitinophagaceae bacterium]|nr:hypothetical protein [Chitinophagaceae bacterium]
MSLDNLSGMPEWEDDEFDNEDKEGEEWKPNPTRDACKAMYEQWKEVMTLLNAAFDTDHRPDEPEEENDEKSLVAHSKAMIIGDAFQVAVKIKSSEVGMYMIRMENAGIIRKNAQFIKSNMLTMIAEGAISDEHGRLIRAEIDKFRELFKVWVASFEKDEFEDEWGLYN